MFDWVVYRPPKMLNFSKKLRWSKSSRLLKRVALLVVTMLSSSDKNIRFYWIKFVNYVKLFEIQATDCYKINVTFISFTKDGLLKFAKSEFRHVLSFSCIWKKDGKVSVKFPARRNLRGWGVGWTAAPSQIFAKVDFLPIDNYSEKK